MSSPPSAVTPAKKSEGKDIKEVKTPDLSASSHLQRTDKPPEALFGGALALPDQVEVEDSAEFSLNEKGALVRLPPKPATLSEDVEKALKGYLEALRRKLQRAELARSKFEVKTLESSSFAKVTIAKPVAAEAASFKAMLQATASKMPEHLRSYYLVDGQRMIDQYSFVRDDYLILFVHQAFQPTSLEDMAANYWEFYTDQPNLYFVSDEGQIQAPQGIITYNMKPWLAGYKMPERYTHLFKRP